MEQRWCRCPSVFFASACPPLFFLRTPSASAHRLRTPAFAPACRAPHLRARLAADDRLQVPHDRGEGVRACGEWVAGRAVVTVGLGTRVSERVWGRFPRVTPSSFSGVCDRAGREGSGCGFVARTRSTGTLTPQTEPRLFHSSRRLSQDCLSPTQPQLQSPSPVAVPMM